MTEHLGRAGRAIMVTVMVAWAAANAVAASSPAAPKDRDFDPLARAQAHFEEWARVPSPEELAGPPTSGAPTTTASPAMWAPSPSGPRGPVIAEYFPLLGETLVFPAEADTADAIRRMATGRVSALPAYCARTLREALGWGLGDAAQWVALPTRGYRERLGTPPAPGDILVWPFTFAKHGGQHVGIAVGTPSGQIRLLSNLGGRIAVSIVPPGFRAFWR
jgi:hypothetical protein